MPAGQKALQGLGLATWHSLPGCPGKFSNTCGTRAERASTHAMPRIEVALRTALTLHNAYDEVAVGGMQVLLLCLKSLKS